jgi:succinoglycan biosynthesis protein ExoA
MMVTAILPTFNEERHIGRCLDGVLRQRGVEDFEILVVDGQSRDRTLDVVRSFPEYGTRIRIIENPRRYQVYAWNLGFHAAVGQYISFVSAHTVYGPDHFRSCLDVLERTNATAVGPVQHAEGIGALGKAIAWCMSSPMGVGNARYRFTEREEEAESAFSMVIHRDEFERLGGYDERVAFDEDSEFCYRLRATGGRIMVSPTSQVRYLVRNSLSALCRQMFCYGYWRRFTQVLHPDGVPLRVYAPPAFVAGLVLSAVAALTPLRVLAPILPAVYAAYVLACVGNALPKLGLRAAACIAAVLPCMHVSYGLGFWRALTKSPRSVLTS